MLMCLKTFVVLSGFKMNFLSEFFVVFVKEADFDIAQLSILHRNLSKPVNFINRNSPPRTWGFRDVHIARLLSRHSGSRSCNWYRTEGYNMAAMVSILQTTRVLLSKLCLDQSKDTVASTSMPPHVRLFKTSWC